MSFNPLLPLLLLIIAENILANEPLRSWYPYRQQSVKQRRESTSVGVQQYSGSGLELPACPLNCRCYAKMVRCSGQGLTDIPKKLPLDTEKLVISQTSITRLNKEVFRRLPSVAQIVLSQNNISEIEDGTFANVENLQYLDLRQNNLHCIYNGTFQGTRNLRVLKLDQNQISWISSGAFSSSFSLQWLSLGGNPIQCDCHLAAAMRTFMETNRQSVFASSGAVCDASSPQFPGAVAANVLGLLFCPPGIITPVPQTCQQSRTAQLTSCQTVCSCDTSGFVSCVGKNLKSVPQDLPENLISLNIANNQLMQLPKNAFSKYTSLRKLNLEGNKIADVSPNAFSGLRLLSSLYLTDNRIRSFALNTFKELSSLTILYLQKNNISCIGLNFFEGLTNLRILHLSENVIETIEDGAFNNLKQLRYLYMANNQLNCDCSLHWLPEFLKRNEAGGSHWTTCHMPVNLKGQYVRDITLAPCVPGEKIRQCKQEPDVQHYSRPQQDLDVAQDCPKGCNCIQLPNRVQRSADDVITFTAMRPGTVEILEPSLKVSCVNQGLMSIPIGVPENTKELYLDYNSISEISADNLTHLKKLEVLSLHHNELSCIRNETFAGLPKLKVLQLHSNNIQYIESAAFDLKSLKLVSLDENPLNCGSKMAWISQWIQRNPTLIMAAPTVPTCANPVHLKGSPIASLSIKEFNCSNGNSTDTSCENDYCSSEESPSSDQCPDVCVCKNQRVDCSGKALIEIPKGLPKDTRDLFLEHNAIKSIDPERLYHLKNLETLFLSHNKILELSAGVFKNLSSLKSLVLSSNGLRCIHSDAFIGLKQLKVLILQNNDISTLMNGTFRDSEQMNTLALGQNPLNCDCNLRWLQSFFRTKYLDNGVAICSSPRQMKYKPVFHSNPRDFICSGGSEETNEKCNPCSESPCLNGGKCEAISGVKFKCTCETPFYGDRCEKQMDICFGKPCKNGGTCKMIDSLGHYRCECSTGFTGPNCEENIDDCKDVVCKNGGVCVDGVNNYTCECAPGFRGKLCEDAFQYCIDENPCKNEGVCVMHNPTGFKCICPQGWGGLDCSENLDDCEYNKCQNGGTCKDSVGGYNCECPRGYTGEYCEHSIPSRITVVKSSVSFGCTFNRCMNGSVCHPDMSPIGYRCNCPSGHGGTFCEKVYSVSLTTADVHIPIQPPSRGCFVPRGNFSLTFSTTQQQGILFFFSESTEKTLSSHRFLIAELYHGHVKISFAIETGEVAVAYSMSKLADGVFHRLDILVIIDRVEMYVDGVRNALIQSAVPKTDPSNSKSRALVSASPIYLAGAPKRLIKSASRNRIIGSTNGFVGCIESFSINDKLMDFSAALKNSNRLNPGCGTSSSLTKTLNTDSNSKPFYLRSKTESTQSTDSAIIRVTVNIGDCRSPDSACLNGGVCIPEYALPGNSQNRQWASSPSRHVCRCPSGFEGTRCESTTLCKRHSRYSYIYDPDTGCISTRRVMIRSCSGSCQEGAATSLIWEQEERQRKRRMRKRARRRVRRHRSQWNPYSSSPSPGLNRVSRNTEETSGRCCQPIRFKQKRIQFHCPKNGGSGVNRVYSRWFRFVRKCGCTPNCDSGVITTDGTPSAGF
ncbi:unnamed protein product [Hymenolepis diminuta]|uniref:Protein slit n=2 Tax=Hymenolepis diminuta TaxID=6216 RepID=A0A564Z3N1_HYMDI|nr:unnamed protein product [Hymenolepis diminuta]